MKYGSMVAAIMLTANAVNLENQPEDAVLNVQTKTTDVDATPAV